jgi:hypothetical protein
MIIPKRPVSPPAPDSLSVPGIKLFTTSRSVGSGAAADIRSRVRAAKDIIQSVGDLRRRGREWYHVLLEKADLYAQMPHHNEERETTCTNDPTWGFRVFVTSFSPAVREKLPRALANWVRAQEMEVEIQDIAQPYKDEVIKRFKLDIVEDESLENASDDRIREEFRAWMRGLDFTARNEHEASMRRAFVSTTSNPSENICLALDEASITKLADLTFPAPGEDMESVEDVTVRAIDCTWRRPAEVRINESYRGAGDVSVNGLAYLYEFMASPVGGGWSLSGIMHDLHPLIGMPEWTGELS